MKTIQSPPCPFWRAATIDQRSVDPDAPAPLSASEPGSIRRAAEMLEYHGGLSRLKSHAIAQILVVAANNGLAAKITGFFRQTFTPNDLSGGLLDKELDTGLLRGGKDEGAEVVGTFSSKARDAMFSADNAGLHNVDGNMVRALNADELDRFVEKNQQAIGAGAIHAFMAKAEAKGLLLGMFGEEALRPDGSSEKVVTERLIEAFYEKGIFPHARLRD